MSYKYIEKNKRKKILLIADDLRMSSGISTIARTFVLGTAQHFNYVSLGGAINHPDNGKRFDLSPDTNKIQGITDASVFLYPINGYGDQDLIRNLINLEKPDALMLFTDPRYFMHVWSMENEIRKKIPIIYLNIWDGGPQPYYNSAYYEACDLLMAISKQTLNLNKQVLREKAKSKLIKYVPHGIEESHFFNIKPEDKSNWDLLQATKKRIFGEKEYKFVLFYNARNLRRKCTSDLIVAWRVFCDEIGPEKSKECCLLLHTQPVDENGTDLPAVKELLCNPEYCNVIFSDQRVGIPDMNCLYNLGDATALISSNEGWGLSLTESMMCERIIIANVQGGMQDQMRFEDENGKWIDFNKDFLSNHYGTYKKCGEWAIPVFPSNLSLVGSIPTPYIWDERADFRDVTKAIKQVYDMPTEEKQRRGRLGRDWVSSDESQMSARAMNQNIVDSIDILFESWSPRKKYELLQIEDLPAKYWSNKIIY